MWLLGLALALVPVSYGVHGLQTGHARFFGHSGATLDLTGSAASAMAVAYIALGLFLHAHWFWGLNARLAPFSPLLKVLAILGFLGGLGFASYRILAS